MLPASRFPSLLPRGSSLPENYESRAELPAKEKPLKSRGLQRFSNNGGDKRDRTADLLNAIQALSPYKRVTPPLKRGWGECFWYAGELATLHRLPFNYFLITGHLLFEGVFYKICINTFSCVLLFNIRIPFALTRKQFLTHRIHCMAVREFCNYII